MDEKDKKIAALEARLDRQALALQALLAEFEKLSERVDAVEFETIGAE